MNTTSDHKRLIEGRACALVFAASQRAPAFEAQVRVLEEQAEELEAKQILVAYLFDEGDSQIGPDRVSPEDVRALRARYGVSDEDFQIVLVNGAGEVVRMDDAPLQGAVILRVLNSDGS